MDTDSVVLTCSPVLLQAPASIYRTALPVVEGLPA